MVAQKIKAWLELLRLPNLFTVPGDVLVGWCLMGGLAHGIWPICLTITASLCLYATGLLLNDVMDVRVDTRERPQRPIPSGRVSLRSVLAVTPLLGTLGLVLAWQTWPCAATLLGLVVDGCLPRRQCPVWRTLCGLAGGHRTKSPNARCDWLLCDLYAFDIHRCAQRSQSRHHPLAVDSVVPRLAHALPDATLLDYGKKPPVAAPTRGCAHGAVRPAAAQHPRVGCGTHPSHDSPANCLVHGCAVA